MIKKIILLFLTLILIITLTSSLMFFLVGPIIFVILSKNLLWLLWYIALLPAFLAILIILGGGY